MAFKLQFLIVLLVPSSIFAINLENLIGELMQGGGPDLKTLQNVYSILPQEVRDKFTKDLLQNPGKVGKDVLNMFGPQLESMVSNFIQGSSGGGGGSSNSINGEYDDSSNPTYGAGAPKGPRVGGTGNGGSNGGFDWSPLTSMVGNLISQNPQMLLSMASGLIQNTKDGINLDSVGNMISENFDINTVLTIAQSLGIGPGKNNKQKRGEGEANEPSLIELLKINELLKMWKTFINSPIGRRANFIVPRLLKTESIEDAIRLLERETGFNFNMILLQLEDRTLRNALISQLVQPVTNLLKTIEFPVDDFKTVQKKIDELFLKLGYPSFKSSETVEPAFEYIRDRFKLTKGSVYELSVSDIETILNDILLNEVLEPMKLVTRAYGNSRGNAGCTTFIYCQLNYNFYNENFLKKNVIRLSSIISGFQVSKVVRNTFSEVYESISRGAEGKDCTRGVQSQCLDLMNTPHHFEL